MRIKVINEKKHCKSFKIACILHCNSKCSPTWNLGSLLGLSYVLELSQVSSLCCSAGGHTILPTEGQFLLTGFIADPCIFCFSHILHIYVAQMLYLLTSFQSFGLKTAWYLPALIQYLSCIAMFGITRQTFVLLNANSTLIMKIRVFKLLFVECIHEFIGYLIEQFLNIRNCLIWVEELSC